MSDDIETAALEAFAKARPRIAKMRDEGYPDPYFTADELADAFVDGYRDATESLTRERDEARAEVERLRQRVPVLLLPANEEDERLVDRLVAAATKRPSTSTPIGATWEVECQKRCKYAFDKGAAEERARVVAWLRAKASTVVAETYPADAREAEDVSLVATIMDEVADCIERGDHDAEGGK